MPRMREMLQAPAAVAYWMGLAGRKPEERSEHIIFLFHGTPRGVAGQLQLQLRYLQRVFSFVPLATITASIAQGRPPRPRPQAAIIFDDGLRSNVTVAYPILCALGIPATFFVCPGLIEERRWLWTHEARRRLQFADAALRGELATELGAPAEVEAFVNWMKELELPQRRRAELRLREATAGYVPSAQDCEAFDLAQWHELRSLNPAIVTVGSHSMTHPILPKMSEPEIESEVSESRRMIEAHLARAAEFFSYPNCDVDRRTLAAVRRQYRAAVAHTPEGPLDPHLLPSTHLPRGVLRLAFKLNRCAAPPAASRAPLIEAGTPAA